eukprot:2740930-Rhodomonas_salina.1
MRLTAGASAIERMGVGRGGSRGQKGEGSDNGEELREQSRAERGRKKEGRRATSCSQGGPGQGSALAKRGPKSELIS